MKDTQPPYPNYGSRRVVKDAGSGQKILMDTGLDRSTVAQPASSMNERMRGGKDYIGHSITGGVKAHNDPDKGWTTRDPD